MTFNGQPLPSRDPLRTTEAILPTVFADESGNLHPTERKTRIDIYQVAPGEAASIYELGIPVVETGDVFHYDVRQRVPLPINRNNIHPSYLKRIRGAALNATSRSAHGGAGGEQGRDGWSVRCMPRSPCPGDEHALRREALCAGLQPRGWRRAICRGVHAGAASCL